MDEGARTGIGSAGPQKSNKDPKDPKDGSNSGPDNNSGGPFGGDLGGGPSSEGGLGSGPAGGEGTNARISFVLAFAGSLVEQIVEVLSLISQY